MDAVSVAVRYPFLRDHAALEFKLIHDAPGIAGRVMAQPYQNGLRVVSPLVNIASTT